MILAVERTAIAGSPGRLLHQPGDLVSLDQLGGIPGLVPDPSVENLKRDAVRYPTTAEQGRYTFGGA